MDNLSEILTGYGTIIALIMLIKIVIFFLWLRSLNDIYNIKKDVRDILNTNVDIRLKQLNTQNEILKILRDKN